MVTVTTGDTQPLLTLTVKDSTTGNAVDLTTATSVTWHFTRDGADITKTATITSPKTNGITTVQWDGDALITPSTWAVRAVIVWNDTTIETTTNSELILVQPAA